MVKLVRSTVIDAPVDAVWAAIRDFNSHKFWHPAIADSVIEDGRAGDEVGCVRRFILSDGESVLRERLLALDDRERSFTYCLTDAPIPLDGYVATVRLRPVSDGDRTFWDWRSEFTCPPSRRAELVELVGEGVYQAGFEAIRERLSRTPSARAGAAPRSARAEPSSPTSAAREPAAPAVRRAGGAIESWGMVMTAHGGPEVLERQTVEVPAPGPGEVRLRHTAIGLNFIDVYCRTGYFRLVDPPGILGMEAAGVVTDVGPGVHGLGEGDRVGYACPPPGAYAERRTMAADLLVPLPDDIPDETAAAGLLKGMTAAFLLHDVHRVTEGDTILVHAAAGGVGTLLCQWGRRLGATVIGTAGGPEKTRRARENGCAFPIDTTRQDFVAAVRDITDGRGCDVVYDAVGRDTIEKSFEALAVRGHLVSFGQASGPLPLLDMAGYAGKSACLSRPNYAHYTGTAAAVRRLSDRLFEGLRAGWLRVEAGQSFPLARVADAHRALESRQTTGSTILTL
ncbi:SRPBCC family protein [Marivibrio halodurans]|uniref:SRPBCC family protein n=1 Tax=Marivibrio halodurans TaxID=2039722 RepID=A0A8J7V3U2_9PROT|nr:SRPBCC family protein [Marivibrio halodurans]